MNEFETNNEMELLLQAKQNQPDLYAQLPATTKMQVGIYESAKPMPAIDLAGAKTELASLKAHGETSTLTPSERMANGIKISNLEAKINDTNTK